jgi:glycosyltransferase involved in cell wall biosynthesis
MDRLAPPHRHTVVAMKPPTTAAAHIHEAAFDLQPAPATHSLFPSARAIAARVRALRPDLVLTYNWGAIAAVLGCRLAAHRALIHHEEGFSADESVRLLRRRTWARRLLLRGAARVVVPSALLRGIATSTWWVPPSRVRHLPNGVDLRRFHPRRAAADPAAAPSSAAPGPSARDMARDIAGRGAAARAASANGALGVGGSTGGEPSAPPAAGSDAPGSGDGQPRRPVVVGSVARLRPEKNLPALVEALALCQLRAHARLVLIGDGDEAAAIRTRAARLGVADQVELRGNLADVAPAYRELDVFAMSSLTEQMPLGVLEAMASGLPVVAPAVGDIASMVAPDNAELIVPPRDLAALAAALDRAIASASLRARIGAANRAHCAARYDLDACLQAHLDLYAEVLGAPL